MAWTPAHGVTRSVRARARFLGLQFAALSTRRDVLGHGMARRHGVELPAVISGLILGFEELDLQAQARVVALYVDVAERHHWYELLLFEDILRPFGAGTVERRAVDLTHVDNREPWVRRGSLRPYRRTPDSSDADE